MPQRLSCHHGHSLEMNENTVDGSDEREFVCPYCGSVTQFRRSGDTRRNAGYLATLASDRGSDSSQDADAKSNSSDAADFVTLDFEFPTDGSGQGIKSDASSGSANLSHAGPSSSAIRRHATAKYLEPPSLPGYEIVEELGRGGMGIVYRVREESLARDVALKTLQRMNPDNLHRFKQEFRALADIAHPNLASLYELVSDGQTWCFTMEILEGVEFLEYIWSGFEGLGRDRDATREPVVYDKRFTAERLERLQNALAQLAVGLNALHKANKLHSDIKPSNVIVTRDARVVLLDFGLVVEMEREKKTRKSKLIQGTPHYMSPEQANADRLTPASDWYAVGVMLYEVLTGRLPFRGPTMEILNKKQLQSATDPAEIEDDVPQHLNDLCKALMDRNPAKRPAAADILQVIGRDDLAKDVRVTSRASAVRTVQLVGREQHFSDLRKSFDEVSVGNTRSVFVHGKSGMGKSVLVNNFLEDITSRNEAVVLEGRCYEQESVPFKALDSLIDALADFLGTLAEDVTHGLMPRDRNALIRVFPVLGAIPEAPNARYPTIENADQQELRQRAMNALRELLQRLAIRAPLVLYIDDLQWGDADSAALLANLVRPPDAPQMLLLGSYRTEDVERSMCLQALAEAYSKGQHLPHREEMSVESLSQDDSKKLAFMLLDAGDDRSEEFAAKIAQESGGWPFFVWELAQHVQEDPEIADQALELDDVIWTRVNRLSKDAMRLLELVAVAGRPIPAIEAFHALDAKSQGSSSLAQLRASNFVRTTESEDAGTVVETYHDRIRESVYNHLDNETVVSHYLSLARMIEQVSGLKADDLLSHIEKTPAFEEPSQPYSLDKRQWQRVFDLAYFFDASGEHKRALPFALVAAEQAWTQNSLDVAQQQFEIARRGAESAEDAIRFRVAEGLGDVLMMRGRYDQGSEQFEAARSLAKGNVFLARMEGKLGYLFFKKGVMENAARYFEQALTELGNPPPSNLVTQFFALAKEGVSQILHTYFPSWFVARREGGTDTCRMDLMRARIYDGLAYPYWFTASPIQMLWTHLRHVNLAERYPDSQELGRAYAFHAITMTAIPLAERGARYADRSYEIHGETGDRLGQGKARSFQTFSLLALGKFKEGVESGREAVDLLTQAGDVWEANMARIILSQPLYFLGDLRNSYLEAKQAYEMAKETGDYSGMSIALYFWAPAAPHLLPKGAMQIERERERQDPLSTATGIQGRGLELLLGEDNPEEGAKVIDESLVVARKRGLRNPCIFCGVSWKATALRIVAQRESEGPARRTAMKVAKRAIRKALKITKKYLTLRSRALREWAIMAMHEDREEQARKYFAQSLSVVESQAAEYERAHTILAQGEAGMKFGWPDAQTQIEQAKQKIGEMEDVS